jgi:hypothetical protein
MGIDISPFRCSSAQVEQIQLSPRGFTLGVYIHALPPQRDPICAYGWLDYELLSSPSAIHVMTDLLGDCNNEVDDEDDDDEDGDDGEIGFAQPIRLNGGRILAGCAIPGMAKIRDKCVQQPSRVVLELQPRCFAQCPGFRFTEAFLREASKDGGVHC